MTQPHSHITRELDRRTGDGIEVRLLWCQNDGHVTVAVTDTKTGEAFELPVHEGERALERCSITPTRTRRRLSNGVSRSPSPIRSSHNNPKGRQRCITTPTPNLLSPSRPDRLEVR
jgi:hypothetical protein